MNELEFSAAGAHAKKEECVLAARPFHCILELTTTTFMHSLKALQP